ncbi:MAG: tetratricopeptide repeat protein [Aggregatilineales bacterium]
MSLDKANDLKTKGEKLYYQHDYEAAARTFQEARDLYDTAGDEEKVAEMKVNTGLTHRALGESQQALEIMQDALRTFQKLDKPLQVARVMGNLGGVYSALNDKEQAYETYREAADIFLAEGENELYSETLLALGGLQMRDGKVFMAAATYQIGLEGIKNPTGRQKLLMRLTGIIAGLQGRI